MSLWLLCVTLVTTSAAALPQRAIHAPTAELESNTPTPALQIHAHTLAAPVIFPRTTAIVHSVLQGPAIQPLECLLAPPVLPAHTARPALSTPWSVCKAACASTALPHPNRAPPAPYASVLAPLKPVTRPNTARKTRPWCRYAQAAFNARHQTPKSHATSHNHAYPAAHKQPHAPPRSTAPTPRSSSHAHPAQPVPLASPRPFHAPTAKYV